MGSGESSMVKCGVCGVFVLAALVDGELVPTLNACPDCGATDFVDAARN